jgi:hypothetical protein
VTRGLALLVLLAASPAAAYVRTTSKGTGAPLAWPVPVVTWQLNRAWPHTSPSCAAGPAGDPTADAVRASFAQWEQGCSNLRLLYAGESDEQATGLHASGGSFVVFRSGWCSQNPAVVDQVTHQILDPCMNDPELTCGEKYGCYQDPPSCIGQTTCAAWSIVALTTVLHDPSSGRIVSADVEVNGWDGVAGPLDNPPRHGWYFTCFPGTQPATVCGSYGQGSCTFEDIQNTVTHEAGHFVGLAHPCGDPGLPSCISTPPPGEVPYGQRTMAPTTSPGETSKRSLSPDDVAGVCAIYPPPSGGCGCGGGEGAGAASLLLLLFALRTRGRRPLTRDHDTISPA